MGKSLSFRGAVYEATDLIKHHRCKDPVCNTQLWKTRHQLDMAKLRIRQLEANIKEVTLSPTSKEYACIIHINLQFRTCVNLEKLYKVVTLHVGYIYAIKNAAEK